MAFMGGGNPISVAANFRLVFDTRSATRTATQYDAAMSRLNDRYLMESTMTNEDYLRDKKAIEIEY